MGVHKASRPMASQQTFNQCSLDVGSPSATLDQHCANNGSTFRDNPTHIRLKPDAVSELIQCHEQWVSLDPELAQCLLFAGDDDHFAKIRCRNNRGLMLTKRHRRWTNIKFINIG